MDNRLRPNAGVDVRKVHPDPCCDDAQPRLANDSGGWGEVNGILKSASVDLVVIEATGSYERDAVCAMREAQMVVARANARQARDFAKSKGVRAKTNQVDTGLLRDFADVLARQK